MSPPPHRLSVLVTTDAAGNRHYSLCDAVTASPVAGVQAMTVAPGRAYELTADRDSGRRITLSQAARVELVLYVDEIVIAPIEASSVEVPGSRATLVKQARFSETLNQRPSSLAQKKRQPGAYFDWGSEKQ